MTTFGTPSYGLTRTLAGLSHDDAVARVTEALKGQGFGVLTTIDMTATLKDKIEVDLGRPYTILGACNPPLAHAAVSDEPGIGLLLPCNVVVTAQGDDAVVSAIDPEAMFSIVDNPSLAPTAADVKARLEAALEALSAG